MKSFSHVARLLSVASFAFPIVIPTSSFGAAQTPCTPATMAPRATSIPANLPAFGYDAISATESAIHLSIVGTPNTEVGVTIGPVVDGLLKILPKDPLKVGLSYELRYESFCNYGPIPAEGPIQFTVADAAPLPTKVGEARTTPTVVLKDYGTTKFTLSTSYTLAPEMKPWVSVYRLAVVVDGRAIETHAALGSDGSSVSAVAIGWCDKDLAARPKHAIQLRGTLPFSPSIATDAVDLAFDCPAPNIAAPPPGNPVAPKSQPSAAPKSASSGSSSGCSLARPYDLASPLVGSIAALGAVAAFLARASQTKRRGRPIDKSLGLK